MFTEISYEYCFTHNWYIVFTLWFKLWQAVAISHNWYLVFILRFKLWQAVAISVVNKTQIPLATWHKQPAIPIFSEFFNFFKGLTKSHEILDLLVKSITGLSDKQFFNALKKKRYINYIMYLKQQYYTCIFIAYYFAYKHTNAQSWQSQA